MSDERMQCTICEMPLATGDCQHVLRADGVVTMTEQSWEKLLARIDSLASDLHRVREELDYALARSRSPIGTRSINLAKRDLARPEVVVEALRAIAFTERVVPLDVWERETRNLAVDTLAALDEEQA